MSYDPTHDHSADIIITFQPLAVSTRLIEVRQAGRHGIHVSREKPALSYS